MTIDIETIINNASHLPYLICGYSNSNFIHSFIKDSLDVAEMFYNFFDQIVSNKDLKKLNIFMLIIYLILMEYYYSNIF